MEPEDNEKDAGRDDGGELDQDLLPMNDMGADEGKDGHGKKHGHQGTDDDDQASRQASRLLPGRSAQKNLHQAENPEHSKRPHQAPSGAIVLLEPIGHPDSQPGQQCCQRQSNDSGKQGCIIVVQVTHRLFPYQNSLQSYDFFRLYGSRGRISSRNFSGPMFAKCLPSKEKYAI